MFTPEERARMRTELLELAGRDARVSGTAITGSHAAGREDRWSDIDLAFGVSDAAQVEAVFADFTAVMYERYRALHHLDMTAGAWIYRVFFLPGTLQVDLAFVGSEEFRPLGATFQLVSGTAKPMQAMPAADPKSIIGMAWLYALHARSCIVRGKSWQAEYIISAVRDHALMLACVRMGLPSAYGRGMDQLSEAVKAQMAGALVRSFEREELWRAFRAAVRGLLSEARHADAEFAARIEGELRELCAEGGVAE